MSYPDPLTITVGPDTFSYARIFSNSKDSKYLDVASVMGTNETTVNIRHSSGAIKKGSAKRQESHNFLLTQREWDSTNAEFDTLKVSTTVTTVSGSTVIDRTQINLLLAKAQAAMASTTFVDRLLRNET